MKRFFQLITCSLLVILAVACAQGNAAINKAYDEALKAKSAIEVATTLCNGQIDCQKISGEEAAKLGALLDYIAINGLKDANFRAQVDMYQFGNLVDGFRERQSSLTPEDLEQMKQFTQEINSPFSDK